jgi:hypothetical protein
VSRKGAEEREPTKKNRTADREKQRAKKERARAYIREKNSLKMVSAVTY